MIPKSYSAAVSAVNSTNALSTTPPSETGVVLFDPRFDDLSAQVSRIIFDHIALNTKVDIVASDVSALSTQHATMSTKVDNIEVNQIHLQTNMTVQYTELSHQITSQFSNVASILERLAPHIPNHQSSSPHGQGASGGHD
jgi:hypothetical protein